jgi:hypothetical protein
MDATGAVILLAVVVLILLNWRSVLNNILAAVAEHERAISARTKAALAAAKARGVKLGGPKLKQAQRRVRGLLVPERSRGASAPYYRGPGNQEIG